MQDTIKVQPYELIHDNSGKGFSHFPDAGQFDRRLEDVLQGDELEAMSTLARNVFFSQYIYDGNIDKNNKVCNWGGITLGFLSFIRTYHNGHHPYSTYQAVEEVAYHTHEKATSALKAILDTAADYTELGKHEELDLVMGIIARMAKNYRLDIIEQVTNLAHDLMESPELNQVMEAVKSLNKGEGCYELGQLLWRQQRDSTQ